MEDKASMLQRGGDNLGVGFVRDHSTAFSPSALQMFNKMPYKPPSKILVGPFLET